MRGSQKNKNYKIEWTPDFAYAVGLLTTDGNLSNDGRHITFVSKDKDLIKTFRNCLNLDNKIGLRKSGFTGKEDCFHIQFTNTKLYNYLLNIGLMPNKSKILGEVKIPDEYFFDFLRGHFDGDGNCFSYWDKRWDSSFMFYLKFYSASKTHILWLRSELENSLDIKGSLSCLNYYRKNPLYQLKYAKNEAKILISKIYYKKNLPCLARKYKKLKLILETDRRENERTLKLNGRVMESVDIYA